MKGAASIDRVWVTIGLILTTISNQNKHTREMALEPLSRIRQRRGDGRTPPLQQPKIGVGI